MIKSTLSLSATLTLFASAGFAGNLVPMPGAGLAGPAALIAAIGAVVGVKYLAHRRRK